MPAPPGSAAIAAKARRSASAPAETWTRSPATARRAASSAGRASTRTSPIPSPASWPSRRSSTVAPSHGSSAAGPPPVAGTAATTIAVVTAVGSRTGAPAAGARPPTAVPVSVTPLVKAGGD